MPRKNLKTEKYTDDAKRIVKNAFEYCKEEKEQGMKISLSRVMDRTSALTGVSVSSIKRMTKPESASSKEAPSEKTQRAARYSIDEFDQGVLRRTINTMYTHQKILPTLNNIKVALFDAIGFTGSKSFLRKQLKKIGFTYRRCQMNRKVLMERADVVQHRIKYLRQIKELREAGYKIVYTDETYVHTNHSVNKCWQTEDIGLKVPFSKGERMIILHAGYSKGFIPGAALTFKAKSSSGDYHSEMNSVNFLKWLQELLIPNLPSNSVLVMDNAAYHNIEVDRCPTTAARKAEIQGWLTRHHVDYDNCMLKAELLQLCKQHRQEPIYVVDDILAQHGHKALRLPPYHADLNPIELIWANLKGHVARNNVSFKLASVRKLIEDGMCSITAKTWEDCIDHVKRTERQYWSIDIAIDNLEDPVVISLESDSETSEGSETDTASESEC